MLASSKEYLDFILEQLADVEGISYRQMMGEYIIYLKGKVAGGIYDNRLLIKPVKAAVAALPGAPMEQPYPGAKQMLLVTELDNKELLKNLFETIYPELSAPKKK